MRKSDEGREKAAVLNETNKWEPDMGFGMGYCHLKLAEFEKTWKIPKEMEYLETRVSPSVFFLHLFPHDQAFSED